MSALSRLQAWYQRHCDGDWEQSWRIRIQTVDNPGWWVQINLAGTALEGSAFAEIADGVDAGRWALGPRWLSCRVEDGIWHGAGDETKLEHILEVFLAWMEEHDALNSGARA